MAKPSRTTRMEVRKNPNYLVEAHYVQECAARRETHVVRLGPILFFSTAGGDAWMLDTQDGDVACLARDGKHEPVPIVETESKFGINWQGFFTLEGGVFTVESDDGSTRTYDGYPVAEIERLLNDIPAPTPEISPDLDLVRTRLALTGRNEPCPCGSGRKYKKCCLPRDEARVRQASRDLQERARRIGQPARSGEPLELAGSDDVLDLEAEPIAGSTDEIKADEFDDGYALSPEVEGARDEIWREFDAIEQPTTEQMNAHLSRLINLPPEAVIWNDLFQLFIRYQHADLPGVFRRIVAEVRPTKGTTLSFLYWGAIEEFVRRGQKQIIPELVAAMCALDCENYHADPLRYVRLWVLAAGGEAEAVALAERFLPQERTDGELPSQALTDSFRALFVLRVGAKLRESATPGGTDPTALARELLRGIEGEVHPGHAQRAAEVICGTAPTLLATRSEFDLPVGKALAAEPVWEDSVRRFEAVMQVAREAWDYERRSPGIALRGLQLLIDAAYTDLEDRPSKLKRTPLNLLDCLHPTGMERRVARSSHDMLGTNPPHAHLLLEAHADLLRFAVRHGLIESHLAAKSEGNIAMLKAKLGFPG